MEQLCRINIDVAFYVDTDSKDITNSEEFDEQIHLITKALNNVVDDVTIDYDSFEVLD